MPQLGHTTCLHLRSIRPVSKISSIRLALSGKEHAFVDLQISNAFGTCTLFHISYNQEQQPSSNNARIFCLFPMLSVLFAFQWLILHKHKSTGTGPCDSRKCEGKNCR